MARKAAQLGLNLCSNMLAEGWKAWQAKELGGPQSRPRFARTGRRERSMTNTDARLSVALGGEFALERTPDGVRIRTPLVHPDGDVIDLFYRESGSGGGIVTDLGETVRWLRMQTSDAKRSAQQTAMIEDIASRLGVEFDRGMLQARVQGIEEAVLAVKSVAEAALRVSEGVMTGG